MRHHPLISWLVAIAAEGGAAGLVSGTALLVFLPHLQVLLAAQASPALASGIFLVLCSQIGVLVSLTLGLMTDWSS
jgi:hypothetical protein